MAAGAPAFSSERSGEALRLQLTGGWTVAGSRELETSAKNMVAEARGARHVVLDLGRVETLDTAGAWLIDRSRARIAEGGADVAIEGSRANFDILLQESAWRDFDTGAQKRMSPLIDGLAEIGESLVNISREVVAGVSFFGRVVASFGRMIVNPWRLRGTSTVYHIENFAFRGLPIIVLINFLVGCIVAQQGIFQLQRFGAATFAVDLIGILVLRELAVLLTSIMVAGRSGSAITAELGSMKMREEIDALSVMGLDPIDVLVMPRMLALIISLPLLTFLGDMAAIFGGMVVAWGYGGLSPEIFMARLQSAIGMNTFLVGLIKAPVMALMIGMIAAIEGLAVKGSAESLGRQVTSSVVKSIFMVILIDGLFAMFFAAIEY